LVSSLRTQVLTQPLTLTCNAHNQRDAPDRHGHHRGPFPPTADFAVIGVIFVAACLSTNGITHQRRFLT
jgi:hypothetical protein